MTSDALPPPADRTDSRSLSAPAGNSPLDSAFAELLSLAPGPIFPRARQLYFRKYPLEGPGHSGPFRTHLLAEQVQEHEGLERAGYLVRAISFAVVYWDGAPSVSEPDYAGYLAQRWDLANLTLTPEPELWFRGEGHYARFHSPATYSSGG